MTKRKNTRLNCFSPPVMLATLMIESGLAIYTVWRYKFNDLTRLITIFLFALATFQLSEYFVCTGNANALNWSKLGFVAITALPPLGLHLMHKLADKPNRRLVATSYASMVGFSAFFLASQTVFTGHQCTGNYVIFQFSPNVTGAYSMYYFGWLLTGISLGALWANQLKAKGKSALNRLEAVRGLVIGYLVFLVPTAVANTVRPETRRGIPSVMCGFAVLLALILVLYIMPRMAENKTTQPVKA